MHPPLTKRYDHLAAKDCAEFRKRKQDQLFRERLERFAVGGEGEEEEPSSEVTGTDQHTSSSGAVEESISDMDEFGFPAEAAGVDEFGFPIDASWMSERDRQAILNFERRAAKRSGTISSRDVPVRLPKIEIGKKFRPTRKKKGPIQVHTLKDDDELLSEISTPIVPPEPVDSVEQRGEMADVEPISKSIKREAMEPEADSAAVPTKSKKKKKHKQRRSAEADSTNQPETTNVKMEPVEPRATLPNIQTDDYAKLQTFWTICYEECRLAASLKENGAQISDLQRNLNVARSKRKELTTAMEQIKRKKDEIFQSVDCVASMSFPLIPNGPSSSSSE